MVRNKEETENEERWLILRAKIAEENIKSAFRRFREREVEPILIKGWAAAREYPRKHQRYFSDIDLSVEPQFYEKCLKMIRSETWGNLNIDLHNGLRHLDTREWSELFDESRIEYLEDVPVRILSNEDHLRVLCIHWLTDGGAYRERLLDIYYLLENHKASFDWEKCFAGIDPKRREWIVKTIAVVHRDHPLDVSRMPFAGELESIPAWFSNALAKEWASETRLQPIHVFVSDRRELWKQLKKRLPPNPVQATIEMEGNFDDKSRIFYQIGSILQRLKPSLKRTLRFLRIRKSGQFEKDV